MTDTIRVEQIVQSFEKIELCIDSSNTLKQLSTIEGMIAQFIIVWQWPGIDTAALEMLLWKKLVNKINKIGGLNETITVDNYSVSDIFNLECTESI